MTSTYWDRDGQQITYSAWLALMMGGDGLPVFVDDVPGDTEPQRVITSWIGYHIGEAGPPLIWETFVEGGPLDGEGDRYATYAEAVRGHAAMVRQLRGGGAS